MSDSHVGRHDWLEEHDLPGAGGTAAGLPGHGVVGRDGAAWVDPDVTLKMRGEGLEVRHVYNSLYGPDSPLGRRWNLSLYGELLTGPGLGGVYSRRINGGTIQWSPGGDPNGYYYRTAGCYNTMRVDSGSPAWLEQTPSGRLLRYEEYACAPGFLNYGHIVSSTDLSSNTYYYTYDEVNRLSEVEDPGGRVLYFDYGEDGRVQSMTDWAGRTHLYEHDAYGNLTSQTGPEGCVIGYTYVHDYMLESLTDLDGYTTYYTYHWDEGGECWKADTITFPNGGTRYYLYDGTFYTRIIDPLGNTVYYTWDWHSHVTHVADTSGRDEATDYDGYNRLTAERNSRGYQTTRTPESPDWGNVLSTQDLAGTTSRSFDSGPAYGNRVTRVQDRDGRTTYYNYDDHANCVQVIDPLWHSSYFEYDQYGQQTAVTNRLGETTSFGWDAYGNMTSVRNPLGETSYCDYDLAGNVIPTTDPLGAVTTMEYDARDKVTQVTDPMGRVSQFGYDGRGNQTVAVRPCGCVNYFDFDGMGMQTRRVDARGQDWTRHYDLLSNLTGESDPLGHTAYHTYDTRRRRTSTTDPRGNVTYFGYDVDNNRTLVLDPLGYATYFDYDGVNRLTTTVDARGGIWHTQYDGESHVTATTDPLSRTTYHEYTPLGLLHSTKTPGGAVTYYLYDDEGRTVGVTDPLGNTVYYLYDAAGRRTAVVDPLGNPTYYLYDAAGRQVKEIDAQGHEEVVTYNAAGQVIRRDKASGVGAYYFYDRGGALSAERRFPSGDVIRYQHDRTDLTTAVYKTGVPDETWQYDATGRVVRHTVRIPGVGATTQGLPMGLNSPGFTAAGETPRLYHTYYGYDQAGNRTSMLFAGPGVAYFTYYAYDARNMLAALTDPFGQTVYYERDALGLEIAKLLPNDVTTYHDCDAAGQVTSILHVGPGGTLQSLYYTYDDDGQRTKIEREDGTRIYFGYDAAHRLASEDWLDPSDVHIYGFAYEYDAAGNRTQKTFNGQVTYYDYNSLNQLTTERVLGGDATYYTWTADGAMETKHDVTGWTYYTWDVDESLKKIEAPDVTLDNRYNARMQRVWRSEDGDESDLIYDSQKLISEAAAGGLSRYYLSEGGSVYSPLVSQLGSQHWFLFDALGSTLGLTNDVGSLSDTFLYEAFGTSLGRNGTTLANMTWYGGRTAYAETMLGLSVFGPQWLFMESPIALDRRSQRDWIDAFRRGWNSVTNAYNAVIDIYGRYVPAGWLLKCYTIGRELRFPAQRYSDFRYGYPPPNTEGDAFRHCMWMCMTAALAGPACAEAVGTGHEVWAGIPNYIRDRLDPPGINQDLINNRIGREMGRCFQDRPEDAFNLCDEACSAAAASHNLWWLRDSGPILPPPPIRFV